MTKHESEIRRFMGIGSLHRIISLLVCCITITCWSHENSFLNSIPQESIYLQTSKNIYESGEDLWFKGYVLNSQSLLLSDKCQTMYISLLKLPDRETVWQEKYVVNNGFVDGHLYVNDSLSSGEYALVGFTPNSVRSEQADIKSFRKIQVIKSIQELRPEKAKPEVDVHVKDIDFQLLPEGGYLVSGIQSKVAFKAVNNLGKPIDVTGILFENEKPILSFKGQHAGMGSFNLIPFAGNSYYLQLDGSDTNYSLPEIKDSGVVLNLASQQKDTLEFRVTQSSDMSSQKIYIRLQQRRVEYTMAEFNLKQQALIKLPINELSQGIVEVTLFNKDRQPLAERLVFVQHDRRLHISATVAKQAYVTKEKVTLHLKVTDENNNPVIAHLGVSVFDKLYQNPADTKTIVSHYQLSTQLKGHIYDPGYYFNPKNKDREQALDLLMLTQGWRAYQWNEMNIAMGNFKRLITDTLKGQLYAKRKKAVDKISNQYLISFPGYKQSAKNILETDSLGRFTILREQLQYPQRCYVYFKLIYGKDDIGIEIKDLAWDTLRVLLERGNLVYPIESRTRKEPIDGERIQAFTADVSLGDVVVSTQKKQVFRDKYLGTLDSIAKYDGNFDYVCSSGILNCPVHENNCDDCKRPIEGETYGQYMGFKWIGNRKSYTFSSISYRQYSLPQYTEQELLEKFHLSVVKNYYPTKKFYEPIYRDNTWNDIQDYRNTLYWKPDVITNTLGEAELTFYTSDINTKFTGIIEGVDGSGLLGHTFVDFQVIKN